MNEDQLLSPVRSTTLNFQFVLQESEAGIARARNFMCCRRSAGEGQLCTFLLYKRKIPVLQGRDGAKAESSPSSWT